MKTSEELKCFDLIAEKMADRQAQIKALIEDYNSDENYDDPVLSIDTKTVTTVCLSYGGPSDYLEITHKEGEIERVIYRYSDWFDTATREVEENSPLYLYAIAIVQDFNY
jgi:hypothetical protein